MQRRTRRLTRGLALALALAPVVLIGPGAAGRDGIPPGGGNLSDRPVLAAGRSEARATRQQFRLPMLQLTMRSAFVGPDFSQFQAEFYVRTPQELVRGGKDDHGWVQPFTVRSVAMGMAVADVTLQVSQVRRGDGYPEAWVMSGPSMTANGQRFQGRAWVQVTGMRLDGQPVRISGACRTEFPAWLDAVGVDGYLPAQGGLLRGSIDLPAFRGCGDVGLDRLLTSFVSGAGNSLEVRQAPVTDEKPPPPFDLPG
jgi:hypothetical protein